ncbi:hypothetical protein P7K49_002420 [Saguinus oedipus]|uniref:Uncharacterized protein n=1 Tax=Saguinus oedipus TaxID=9490 RepID=A0ABQ9WHA8_SAGOE|nr:hypothetical protein P7K49_002420 [Saguinus oedipus]
MVSPLACKDKSLRVQRSRRGCWLGPEEPGRQVTHYPGRKVSTVPSSPVPRAKTSQTLLEGSQVPVPEASWCWKCLSAAAWEDTEHQDGGLVEVHTPVTWPKAPRTQIQAAQTSPGGQVPSLSISCPSPSPPSHQAHLVSFSGFSSIQVLLPMSPLGYSLA